MNKHTVKSWSIVSSIALLLTAALVAVTDVSSLATADENTAEKAEFKADERRTQAQKQG